MPSSHVFLTYLQDSDQYCFGQCMRTEVADKRGIPVFTASMPVRWLEFNFTGMSNMYKTCRGYCCRGNSILGSTGRSVVGRIKAPGINQPSLRSRTVKEFCKTEIRLLFICLFLSCFFLLPAPKSKWEIKRKNTFS